MHNSIEKKGLKIKKGPNRKRRALKLTTSEKKAARGKSTLSPEKKAELNRLGKALKHNPIYQAIISGRPISEIFPDYY